MGSLGDADALLGHLIAQPLQDAHHALEASLCPIVFRGAVLVALIWPVDDLGPRCPAAVRSRTSSRCRPKPHIPAVLKGSNHVGIDAVCVLVTLNALLPRVTARAPKCARSAASTSFLKSQAQTRHPKCSLPLG